MELYIVDAFADEPFCGNPAGVVLLGAGEDFPEADVMRRIAAELRYSETAFVKQLGEGRFHSRYFTPAAEVDLCGHATLAAFHVLAGRGAVGGTCRNLTAAGDLRIEVFGGVAFMEMGAPVCIGTIAEADALCALYRVMGLAYGAGRAALRAGLPPVALPVEMISTGLPDILLPVADRAELFAIAPDFAALAALSERYGAIGVHAFAPAGADGRIHCRNFAPLYAIDEEAATGTSNGALVWYLHRRGMLAGDGRQLFVQGEAMGRPSVIHGRLEADARGEAVWIGGGAVVLASGRLMVNAGGEPA